MRAQAHKATITISLTDLENVIQRVVKKVVRDELVRVLRTPNRAILEYWEHEGLDDSVGDEELLKDALAIIERYEKNTGRWKTLEEFEVELKRAGAAHELPS